MNCLAVVSLALLVGASSLRAQQLAPRPVPVIEAASFSLEVGSGASLRFVLRRAGADDREAWSSLPVEHLFVRAPGFQRNLDDLRPDEPGGAVRTLRLERDGLTRIGLATRPSISVVPAGQLRGWLEAGQIEGRLPPVRAGAGWRVRSIVSASTLLRVGAAAGSAATGKSSLPVELRLLADPTAPRRSADLPVRAYVEGVAVAGTTVVATHRERGDVVRATTDPMGFANLRLAAAGPWCLELQRARAAEDGLHADVDWLRATFTFEASAVEAER